MWFFRRSEMGMGNGLGNSQTDRYTAVVYHIMCVKIFHCTFCELMSHNIKYIRIEWMVMLQPHKTAKTKLHQMFGQSCHVKLLFIKKNCFWFRCLCTFIYIGMCVCVQCTTTHTHTYFKQLTFLYMKICSACACVHQESCYILE